MKYLEFLLVSHLFSGIAIDDRCPSPQATKKMIDQVLEFPTFNNIFFRDLGISFIRTLEIIKIKVKK